MSCPAASRDCYNSLSVRIRGDSRDPGSTPWESADLTHDFQTGALSGGFAGPPMAARPDQCAACSCPTAESHRTELSVLAAKPRCSWFVEGFAWGWSRICTASIRPRLAKYWNATWAVSLVLTVATTVASGISLIRHWSLGGSRATH